MSKLKPVVPKGEDIEKAPVGQNTTNKLKPNNSLNTAVDKLKNNGHDQLKNEVKNRVTEAGKANGIKGRVAAKIANAGIDKVDEHVGGVVDKAQETIQKVQKVKRVAKIVKVGVGLLGNPITWVILLVLFVGMAAVAGGINNVVRTQQATLEVCELPLNSSQTGATGDWLTKGTQANKNAQEVWDYWKAKGFSGASIAGIMGNFAEEGGYSIVDRAEGHFANDDSASIAAGVTPSGGPGYSVGGGGMPQFTPYTKFAPLSDKKWLDVNAQMDFVWSSEVGKATWKSSYAKLSDTDEATKQWFSNYERGAKLAPGKLADAKAAYGAFGGASVQADDSLLGDSSGQAGNNESMATSQHKKEEGDCDDNATDGTLSAEDGTGAMNATDNQRFKGSDNSTGSALPDNVKQYVMPFMLDGKFKSAWDAALGTWTAADDGNCTDLSKAFVKYEYGDTQYNGGVGNGNEVVNGLISRGWSKSGAKAGAVFSTPGPSAAGHTGVVMHVFANGDILIAEQNTELSGDMGGMTKSYNYQYVSASSQKSRGFTFAAAPSSLKAAHLW